MQFWGFEIFNKTKLGDIKPGKGGVINREGKQIAVFRNKDGKLMMMSAKCTHMGCIVHWNEKENTWDCPCHGSKYDKDGKVIRGPAMKDLMLIKDIDNN
jgi:Rieske Fe-S protein